MFKASEAIRITKEAQSKHNNEVLEKLKLRLEQEIEKAARECKWGCLVYLKEEEESILPDIKENLDIALQKAGYNVRFYDKEEPKTNEQLDYGTPAIIEIEWGELEE